MTTLTRSQGQAAYEVWASASGTYSDYFPWDRLSDEDHKRWEMLAKGGLAQHDRFMRIPEDVARFGDKDRHAAWYAARPEHPGVGVFDVITPPQAEFQAWQEKQRKAIPPRWKFWRKRPELDLSEQAYWDSFLKDRPKPVL